MSSDHESTSFSDAGLRKRVTKACDRCRTKKSKCDGAFPCSRCKADDQICNFGERRKSAEKVHPKGYAEALELNVEQLRRGVVNLYKMLEQAGLWPDTPSKDVGSGSIPPLHHILDRVGALSKGERHENDLSSLRSRLEQEPLMDLKQPQLGPPARGESFDSTSSSNSNFGSMTSSQESLLWHQPQMFAGRFADECAARNAWPQPSTAATGLSTLKHVPRALTAFNEWKKYSVDFSGNYNTGDINLQNPPASHSISSITTLPFHSDLDAMTNNIYNPETTIMNDTFYDPMMTEPHVFDVDNYNVY